VTRENGRPTWESGPAEEEPIKGSSAATLPRAIHEYAEELLEEVLGAKTLEPATVWDIHKAVAEGQTASWGTFKIAVPYGSVKIVSAEMQQGRR
jgi:hypothetical protein